jgi:drug/metabolite transporter (DMT)-like permease
VILPPHALASLAMLAAVCLWSSATPATKLAVGEIAVAEFVAVRLAPGLVTLVVSLGLTMTSPVNGSVFWSLTPLLMPVLGYLVLGERLELVVMAAAALAFAATMLLVWGQNQHGGGNWIGDVCVAGGVLASAANALLARLVAALLLFLLPATGVHVVEASPPALLALLYLGLAVSGGVYILSNYALRHMPVGRMGLFSCLVGPVGTAIAALLLGTKVSAADGVALAIVLGAVLLPSLIGWRAR